MLFFPFQLKKKIDDAMPILALFVVAIIVDDFVSQLTPATLAKRAGDALESLFK